MSEYINNTEIRRKSLYSLFAGLTDGQDGKSLIETHQQAIDHTTPFDVVYVVDAMLQNGYSVDAIKKSIGKILNVLYGALDQYEWQRPEIGSFLDILMRENTAMREHMGALRELSRAFSTAPDEELPEISSHINTHLQLLATFEEHYTKKENILFPYMEKELPDYRCLSVMWSFHDDIRSSRKRLAQLTASETPDRLAINKELGVYSFLVQAIIVRENLILFPVAYAMLPRHLWVEMLHQASEYETVFITPPEYKPVHVQHTAHHTDGGLVSLGTGEMLPAQIQAMLNHLPVDITFVDAENRVRYFSAGKERIFPRSKAIIGREVQNCHPPDSVHVVNQIVDSFRKGEKDDATFWIQMRGQFILIRYYAVRDEAGNYLGTVEVSENITEIKELTGERRLLDW